MKGDLNENAIEEEIRVFVIEDVVIVRGDVHSSFGLPGQ
jgi:hypothetical protein